MDATRWWGSATSPQGGETGWRVPRSAVPPRLGAPFRGPTIPAAIQRHDGRVGVTPATSATHAEPDPQVAGTPGESGSGSSHSWAERARCRVSVRVGRGAGNPSSDKNYAATCVSAMALKGRTAGDADRRLTLLEVDPTTLRKQGDQADLRSQSRCNRLSVEVGENTLSLNGPGIGFTAPGAR